MRLTAHMEYSEWALSLVLCGIPSKEINGEGNKGRVHFTRSYDKNWLQLHPCDSNIPIYVCPAVCCCMLRHGDGIPSSGNVP